MPALSLSRTAQAAYQDLLRLQLEDSASEVLGSIEERHRNGRVYLYDKFRIGTEMKTRYLGEGTPERRARLARAGELKAAAGTRREAMTRLARILRAEGMVTTDRETGSLLTAFARAGVFRLGGTVVGTGAFVLYQGELGLRLGIDDLAQTGDIDFASFERLSLSLGDRVEEEPGEILRTMRFEAVPGVEDRQVWKWRQSHGPAMVEFLTPAFGDESVKPLPALGVSAQGLNYLNYLIAEPIPAVALYRSGVLVQVPRPERFAIHKLIVADRRRGGPDQAKARKDRGQAALLIEALAADRPDELREAHEDALARGPRWRERIAASLDRMPATAALLAAL
ncbi:nucleotidyltransferase family protein [Frigidibacter sp. MR17.24]|uniref:nucleotidyltransferase family protein n=1 Tax=Frigidibacter sp. MR17.24 TaxID=3127345 RepID=UPI003012C0E7